MSRFAERVAGICALAALLVAFAVVAFFPSGEDRGVASDLVAVPQLDYTNDYAELGISIVCVHWGTRADFDPNGGDIAAGDRVVRDCNVVEYGNAGPTYGVPAMP